MTVYGVFHSIEWEGSYLLDLYFNESDANKAADKLNENRTANDHFEVEDLQVK